MEEIKNPAKFLHLTYEDEEQLVDYVSEEPEVFSAAEDEVMRSDDNMLAHGDEPAANLPKLNDLPVQSTEGCNVPGRRRSQIVFERGR